MTEKNSPAQDYNKAVGAMVNVYRKFPITLSEHGNFAFTALEYSLKGYTDFDAFNSLRGLFLEDMEGVQDDMETGCSFAWPRQAKMKFREVVYAIRDAKTIQEAAAIEL